MLTANNEGAMKRNEMFEKWSDNGQEHVNHTSNRAAPHPTL